MEPIFSFFGEEVSGLQWVTGEASDNPYPSTKTPPINLVNSFLTSIGREEAPEMQN